MVNSLAAKVLSKKSFIFVILAVFSVWIVTMVVFHPTNRVIYLPEVYKYETTVEGYKIKLKFATAVDAAKNKESIKQKYVSPINENFDGGETRHVLINSIGRSGSSMFGEIISTFSPSPFYVFEPLWAAQMGKFLDPNLSLNMLKDSFNCIFNKLCLRYIFGPESMLVLNGCLVVNNFHPKFARSSTGPYFKKWPHSDRTFKLEPNLKARSFIFYRETLCEKRKLELQRYCPTVNFKVIKVIRLSLLPIDQQVELLEELLIEFENLVIFFLVRDPRAALYSRMKKVFWNATESQAFCVEERRLYMTGRELIERGWGDQVKLLKYEDIALNPETCIRSIADFMKMEVSSRTQTFMTQYDHKVSAIFVGDEFSTREFSEWIKLNMKGGEPASNKELNNPYDTRHRNASSLVRQWEDSDIKLQDICKSVVKDLGYEE